MNGLTGGNVVFYTEQGLVWFFKQGLMKLEGVAEVVSCTVLSETKSTVFVSKRAEKADIDEINRFLEGHAYEG